MDGMRVGGCVVAVLSSECLEGRSFVIGRWSFSRGSGHTVESRDGILFLRDGTECKYFRSPGPQNKPPNSDITNNGRFLSVVEHFWYICFR
jgi:hypothetical protein